MTDHDTRLDPNESYAEQVPPTADETPADAAARAAAGGWREDPPSEGPLVVDSDGMVVDTGSPQDFGDPNEGVIRGPDEGGR